MIQSLKFSLKLDSPRRVVVIYENSPNGLSRALFRKVRTRDSQQDNKSCGILIVEALVVIIYNKSKFYDYNNSSDSSYFMAIRTYNVLHNRWFDSHSTGCGGCHVSRSYYSRRESHKIGFIKF